MHVVSGAALGRRAVGPGADDYVVMPILVLVPSDADAETISGQSVLLHSFFPSAPEIKAYLATPVAALSSNFSLPAWIQRWAEAVTSVFPTLPERNLWEVLSGVCSRLESRPASTAISSPPGRAKVAETPKTCCVPRELLPSVLGVAL